MKKALLITAALLAVMCFAACSDNKDSSEPLKDESSQTVYKEKTEGYILPCDNGRYLLICDGGEAIVIPQDIQKDKVFDELTIGDKVVIEHDDLLETYPSTTNVFSIEKLEDGTEDNISQQTIESLGELGWNAVLPESGADS